MMSSQADGVMVQGGDKLPQAALTYSNIQSGAAFISAVIFFAALVLFVPIGWIASIAGWALLPLSVLGILLDLLLVNRLQYRSYRYSVSSSSVEISHGVLFRSRTTVSTVQILSVDTVRGPLLRGLGLTSVVFRTVGGTVKLGPVLPLAADDIRNRVLGALEFASS